jgi:GNAT superfamily N-acetyltransferase
MEFLEYAQVDPDDVLTLNQLALHYHLDAKRMAEAREHDSRLEPYLALYAVEEGKAVGQVGAMCVRLETTGGPEDFGALWAVATHPDYTRRGISSRLIEQVHDRFRERGLQHCYLTTSRSLVAHRVYRRLGYEDFAPAQQHLAAPWSEDTGASGASGAGGASHADPSLRWSLGGPGNADEVVAVYRASVAGRLGFIHRDDRFLHGVVDLGDLAWDELFLLRSGDALLGYAAIKQRPPRSVVVSELNTLLGVPIDEALIALRRAFAAQYVIHSGVNLPTVDASLERAGFECVSTSGPGVLMMTSLTGPTNIGSLRGRLRVESGRFAFGGLDST